MRPRAAALGGSNLLFFLDFTGSEGRGVPRRAKLDSRADNQPEPQRKWDQHDDAAAAAAAPFAALLTEANQVEENYTQAFYVLTDVSGQRFFGRGGGANCANVSMLTSKKLALHQQLKSNLKRGSALA